MFFSDEGLSLETSALESLYAGKITLSTGKTKHSSKYRCVTNVTLIYERIFVRFSTLTVVLLSFGT